MSEPPKINGPVVWVLGNPGSGKGTQCKKIVAKYGFTHLSSDDLLRAEVASGSERGKELNAIMEREELVPLKVVLDLIRDVICKSESPKGFLINWYPREKEQGVQFELQVAPVNVILFFDAPEETLTKRLLFRGQTSGRVDDREDTIRSRLRTFYKYNDEIVEYCGDRIRRINAERTPDDIFAEVQTYLYPLVK